MTGSGNSNERKRKNKRNNSVKCKKLDKIKKKQIHEKKTIVKTNKVRTGPEVNKKFSKRHCRPQKSIYWTLIDIPPINRIKQVTRSCFNDVILAAVAGALRDYLVKWTSIKHPPNLGITIPVDIGNSNETEFNQAAVNYVLLTFPLPTSTEGKIPRLWEIRHLMEELKSSADPSVMYGMHYFSQKIFGDRISCSLHDLIHRNSSVCVSQLPGPPCHLSIGTYRVRKLFYWMSTPSNVPIVFNLYTYGNRLACCISTTSKLIPCAKRLAREFKSQLTELSSLLSRRRVPGERAKARRQRVAQQQMIRHQQQLETQQQSEKQQELQQQKQQRHHPEQWWHEADNEQISVVTYGYPHYEPSSSIATTPMRSTAINQTTGELADRLNQVQCELYHLADELQINPERREQVELRLQNCRDEFTEIMKQLRRRKSIAEYNLHNIIINIEDEEDEDDDMDGELRPLQSNRRFSFGVASLSSRRSSVVSTSAIQIPQISLGGSSSTSSGCSGAPLLTGYSSGQPAYLIHHSLAAMSHSSPEASSSPERGYSEHTV